METAADEDVSIVAKVDKNIRYYNAASEQINDMQ